MKRLGGFLSMLFALAAVPVLAAPPLYVISSTTSKTHFDWKWPYHPISTWTAYQTKPYYYYTGRILYVDQNIDVTKFRFYHPQRAEKNQWGYYFAPGTYLRNQRPVPIFSPPSVYYLKVQ